MIFDNVYPTATLIPSLSKEYGLRIAVIPFMDCAPDTSYLVSEDGRRVFVSVDFGGYCQVKELQTVPAGKRSKNSAPAFKRRNAHGSRIYATLPAVVYGAFILKDRVPKYKITQIDGNPNNCDYRNLVVADDSKAVQNAKLLSTVYKAKYEKLCRGISICYNVSRMSAQDFISDTFLDLCYNRVEIDPDRAERLWFVLAEQKVLAFKTRNRIVYTIYDAFHDYTDENDADTKATVQSLLEKLPEDCGKVARLVLAGYTQREIASKLGCTQSWISQLFIKLKRLMVQ